MVDIKQLKDAIKNSGVSHEMIAHELGINESTLYRKLQRGGSTITVEQAQKMTDILKLPPDKAQSIFFNFPS